jgi:hypothetical protein
MKISFYSHLSPLYEIDIIIDYGELSRACLHWLMHADLETANLPHRRMRGSEHPALTDIFTVGRRSCEMPVDAEVHGHASDVFAVLAVYK